MSAAADEMVDLSVNDAPVDEGLLRGGISKQSLGVMDYKVVSPEEYAAFIEFGTRARVQIPAGLEEIAAQFKSIGGSGEAAKQAIYDWCKRKGIEQDRWWAVFISVMTNGIHPHPYFFKNFYTTADSLKKRLEDVVKRSTQ